MHLVLAMLPDHRIFLVDIQPDIAAALQLAFAEFPSVSVMCSDILAVAQNAVVSPANSYGFMDGGVDQAYSDFFGPNVERLVQDAIALRPEGLPVGASLTVATGHPRIPYLVVAPTMLMPEAAEASACYRAMRAVLRELARLPEVARQLYCPGLATGTGCVPPQEAADAMAQAYRDWLAR